MIETRHATDPASAETATNAELRDRYVVSGLFSPGEVNGVYTHEDRLVIAGAAPAGAPIALTAPDMLGAETFLERRELGIVNLGDTGTVTVGDDSYELGRLDAIYVGRGNEVSLSGDGARFYLVSALAHATHPTTLIRHDEVEPVVIGDPASAGHRSLYRYVWGDKIVSCQLQFGVTVLEPGSVWNTMPPHLHERRTEVYLYTGLEPDARVIHLMGRPGHTRHVVVGEGDAVIAPSWSIHSGVGTSSSYTFVWAMAGENNVYTDLCGVGVTEL